MGLLSSIFGGSQSHQSAPSHQTTTTAPPAYLKPYLTGIAGNAQDIYNANSSVTPQQKSLADTLISMGSNPQGLSGAYGQLGDTLNGNYLYGGQGFNAALNAAEDQIIPSISSQFEGAGRYGSGLARSDEAHQIGNAFASQYGNERQNQMNAARLMPALNQEQLAGGQAALNTQLGLQQYPFQQLQNYAQIIDAQNRGGTQSATKTTPYYTNPSANTAGLALKGAEIGSVVPGVGTGLGAAIGGGLGLLGSIF